MTNTNTNMNAINDILNDLVAANSPVVKTGKFERDLLIEKHSYYTNFDLVDAFIGIKDISDFEPTSEGLIDIWEYLSKVAALLKARYEQHKRNVPTFEFYEELWWDGLDDGETPEEIFDSLLQITIEIDF